MNMVATAHGVDDMPSVVRYPRGTGYGVEKLNDLFGYNLKAMPDRGKAVEIGKGRVIKPHSPGRPRKVILAGGPSHTPACCCCASSRPVGISSPWGTLLDDNAQYIL